MVPMFMNQDPEVSRTESCAQGHTARTRGGCPRSVITFSAGQGEAVKGQTLSADLWPEHQKVWEGEWGRAASPWALVLVGSYT